jgi:hypothetical protein
LHLRKPHVDEARFNGGLGALGRARRTVERGEARGCVGLRGDDAIGACVLGRRVRLEDG